MSSHREAPEISDLHAFVSPDRPGTVTLIANYIPLEEPPGGPNFYEFGDDVQYDINIDNDGQADITYRFTFTTVVANPDTFLYKEVLVPMGKKDLWNSLPPADDKNVAVYVAHPELAALLPALYPGVFPHLVALVASGRPEPTWRRSC